MACQPDGKRGFDAFISAPVQKVFSSVMKPVRRVKLLKDILNPDHVTTIVDIGANPAGTPPYAMLRRSGCCRIIGFEPQPEAFAKLEPLKRDCETYLPYAVGDGNPATLYLTRNSGLVSTLEPETWMGGYLNRWFYGAAEVLARETIATMRLDDIAEIIHMDFIKIDIQGGELSVFESGREKMRKTAAIQCEVAILPYYKGQPGFGDIQAEMKAQGFIAHKIVEMADHLLNYPARQLAPGLALPPSQLTAVDVIFLRNPIKMADLEDELVRQMAILADAVFGSFDLTLRCLWELVSRGKVEVADAKRYASVLPFKPVT